MTAIDPELSHLVRLDRIGAAPMAVSIVPDQRVRTALAERFDLIAVDSLQAQLSIRRRKDNGWIEVTGEIRADVVQTCVVTTDPVPAAVHAEISELFDDSGDIGTDEIVLDPMADSPEPVDGDSIDVGEVAAQALGLALDPYPRVPGAEPEVTVSEPGDAGSGSPFAKLASIKGRPRGGG
ncbi:MAG: DUF177 domain-containing protein [Thalassobaculum sp.]|uniref:YceD family protein n=1 Tax=Thalassobaculum sp. TaxID=2022740 RepID=UPI0032EE9AD3